MNFLRSRARHATWALFLLSACSPSSGSGGHTTPSGDGGAGADAESDAGVATSGNPIGLWVDGMWAYSAAELAASGAPNPTDACPIPNNGAATTPMAFDGAGNLWVQQAADSTVSVIMWSAAELAAACSSGQPARTIVLSPVMQTPGEISAMAFDSQGTLWVTMPDEDVIYGLSADQIAASGTVAPKYDILSDPTNTAAELYAPAGIAFDTAGNMWVANVFSVLEYHPATLAAALATSTSGANMPNSDAYLSTTGGEAATQNLSGAGPTGSDWPTFDNVAFDKAGNLWVCGENPMPVTNGDYVAQFSASALSALSSNRTPAATITLHEPASAISTSMSYYAVAFDAAGNMWVGLGTDLLRYPPASLAAGGSAMNDLDISNVPFLTKSLAFNPLVAGLPIQP